MKNFDIVVVGSGIVGLTVACLLAKYDLNIALVTQEDIAANKEQTNAKSPKLKSRVSAINLASEDIFKHLGCWSLLDQTLIAPFRNMQVWAQDEQKTIHFDSAQLTKDHLGYIVDNDALKLSLKKILLEKNNIDCFSKAKLFSLEHSQESIIIKMKNEQGQESALITPLLIGADGAHSWVREQAGIMTQKKSYQQTAIVSVVKTEKNHQSTAWQRFSPDGPLAFLPLSDKNFSALVWSCPENKAKDLLHLSEQDFNQQVSQTSQFKLGTVLESFDRKSFPLTRTSAQSYVKPNIALVGDSAHTFHPLAGQGLNVGLLDAAKLVDAIDKMIKLNHPIGYWPLLRTYERNRKFDNKCMMAVVDGCHWLFQPDRRLPKPLIKWGMAAVNKTLLLKMIMMQFATGLEHK